MTEEEDPSEAQLTSALRAPFNLPKDEELVGDFSCAYNGKILFHGRIYVTTGHVCFYSCIFGHVTNFVFAWRSVTRVRRIKTAFVFPSLEISVQEPNQESKFVFSSFFALRRDRCYHLCRAEHRKWCPHLYPDSDSDSDGSASSQVQSVSHANASHTPRIKRGPSEGIFNSGVARMRPRSSAARRRSGQARSNRARLRSGSDEARPTRSASLRDWNQGEVDIAARPSKEDGSPGKTPSHPPRPNARRLRAATASVPLKLGSSIEEAAAGGHTPVAMAPPLPSSSQVSPSPGVSSPPAVSSFPSASSSASSSSPAPLAEREFRDDNLPVLEDPEALLRTCEPVVDVTLPVSAKRFFDMFLADDAPFGMQTFLEQREGVSELFTEQWTEWDDSPVVPLVRTVRYRMPIPSIPFMPSSTRVEVVSRCDRFQDGACVVEASIRSLDVPYGDYFTTHRVWVVTPSVEQPETHTRFRVGARVDFARGTMLRSRIESATMEGMMSFHQDWVEEASNFLDSLPRLEDGDDDQPMGAAVHVTESTNGLAEANDPTDTPPMNVSPAALSSSVSSVEGVNDDAGNGIENESPHGADLVRHDALRSVSQRRSADRRRVLPPAGREPERARGQWPPFPDPTDAKKLDPQELHRAYTHLWAAWTHSVPRWLLGLMCFLLGCVIGSVLSRCG